MKNLIHWCMVSVAACIVSGCTAPWTVKPGSDPVVVHAQQFAREATESLDDFIRFVDRNWYAAGADLRAARDIAAADGPVYIRALRSATKAYQANKNPDTQATVQEKINALQELLNVIREYVKPSTPNANS